MPDNKVRIFVSSPADVDHERAIVKDIVARLTQEFLPYFEIEPILWEEEALTADRTFQAGLIQPSDCQIVLVVLWTRLGSPLPQEPYRGMTGTEWEFFDAVEGVGGAQRPEVLVYKKTNPKLVDITDPQATLAAIEERKRLEDFFQRNFFNADRTFRRAFRTFDSDAAFRDLVEAQLRKLLNRRIFVEKRGPGRAFDWRGSPFRADGPFDFGDERIFTGRETETRDLVNRLREQMESGWSFLLVSGPSGCGKSSLVRAGLLPRLVRPHQIEGVAVCRWCLVDPGAAADPLTALADSLSAREVLGEALEGMGIEPGLLRRSLKLEPALAAGQVRAALQGLTGAIREGMGENDATARLVVVVDPLEAALSASDAAPFAEALKALAECGVAWVVAVVRSDHLCALPRLGDLVRITDPRTWLSLEPPAGARIRQIIEIPALVAGLQYESQGGRSPVEQLESEAARLRHWPPLLEAALERLYRAHRVRGGGPDQLQEGAPEPAGYLTVAALQESGGLSGGVLRRADDLWERLDEDARAALARVCRALVTLEPGAGSRPVPRVGDLRTLEAEPAARRLVERLIEARLVVAEGVQDPVLLTPCHRPDYSLKGLLGRVVRQTREDWLVRGARSGAAAVPSVTQGTEADAEPNPEVVTDWESFRPTAILAHPVLIERWDPIRDWLRHGENREALRLRQQISRQAQIWKRTDCNREYLLGAAGYAAARRFADAYAAELEPAEAELVEQSTAYLGFQRRRNRLVRVTGSLMAVLLVVATVAAFWALDASHTATLNLQSSRLSAADLAIVRGNTPRAVVLALDAGEYLPRRALQTLSRAFTTNRLIALLHEGPPHPNAPFAAAADVAGERAATLDPAVGLRLWRLRGHSFAPEGSLMVPERHFHRVFYSAALGGFLALAPEGAWRLPELPGAGPDYPCGTEPGAAVALSPDGRLLALSHALARDSYAVCLIDLTRPGAVVFDGPVHTGQIRSLAFSPASTRLVTASGDGTAKVLDGASGAVLLTLPPAGAKIRPRRIGRAVFGPGGRIAIAATDPNLWVYTSDGALLRMLAEVPGPTGPRQVHDSAVQDLAFSPDGRYLVAADEDGQVVRWGIEDGSALNLGQHDQTVVSVAVSPDGREVLTASLDKTARLWDMGSGRELAVFSHDGPVDNASFVADGRRAFTVSAQDGTARLWSATPVSPLARQMPHAGHVWYLQFAPESTKGGLRLATAGFDGRVELWDFRPEDGEPISDKPVVLQGHSGPVRRVAFSRQGGRLVSASYDGTARVWDLGDRVTPPRELCKAEIAKGSGPARVQRALFDPLPAGRWVVTASNGDLPFALWDAQTCARIGDAGVLDTGGSAVQAIDTVALPDGALVAAGTDDGRVRVVRQRPDGAWELVCERTLHTLPVLDVALSADGSRVATASEDRWARVLTIDGCGGEHPRIANLAGHTDRVRSVRFSPRGDELVTASTDGTARVWRIDGTLKQVLAGHKNQVFHAEFSPDGRWILTSSRDGTVALWQSPASGAPPEADPYLILTADLGGVPYADFSPDGRFIAAAYWRNAARLWRIWAGADGIDSETLARLQAAWGRERANLVLIREAERFRRENRLDDLRGTEVIDD
jgi:WD40 repeat protein